MTEGNAAVVYGPVTRLNLGLPRIGRITDLSPEDRARYVARLLDAYDNQDATVRELMIETGRSYGAVHRALAEAGVVWRPPGGAAGRAARDDVQAVQRDPEWNLPVRTGPRMSAEERALLTAAAVAARDRGATIEQIAAASEWSFASIQKLLAKAEAERSDTGSRRKELKLKLPPRTGYRMTGRQRLALAKAAAIAIEDGAAIPQIAAASGWSAHTVQQVLSWANVDVKLGSKPVMTGRKTRRARALLAEPGATAASVAKRLKVSAKTIRRHVPELQEGRRPAVPQSGR